MTNMSIPTLSPIAATEKGALTFSFLPLLAYFVMKGRHMHFMATEKTLTFATTLTASEPWQAMASEGAITSSIT